MSQSNLFKELSFEDKLRAKLNKAFEDVVCQTLSDASIGLDKLYSNPIAALLVQTVLTEFYQEMKKNEELIAITQGVNYQEILKEEFIITLNKYRII